jgi:radical SAM protein with 4Fe4S-binding SPASM domain
MEARSYAEFSLQLNRRVIASRIPASGTIELTRRCPLNCQHCYNNLPMGDSEARATELTTDELRRVMDELADAGCLWLLFTGGEILARADFFEIYTYAKQKGFFITLFTNGTLVTERVADFFAEWRPFAIEITLYGATRETYERLTQIPGSYDKCMRGIRLLLDRGLPLKLKSVATTITKHEMFAMKELAHGFGCEYKFDPLITPRIDCSQSPIETRLQPWEVVQLDLLDPDRVAEWKTFSEQFSGPSHLPGREEELYSCGGGMNSFAIDPQGMLSICVISHFDKFDLRRGSFAEGWNDFLFKVRKKKKTTPTKCDACQISAVCGMCPANGELEHADPEKPVDFLCHVAHLRAEVIGIDVPAHGECEYCPGGANHADLLRSAEAVITGEPIHVPAGMSAAALMPAAGCGSGGCGSCGVSHAN